MSRGVCLTSLERRKRRGRPTYCGGDWHVLEWVCYGCVADSNEKDLGEDAPPCSQNCLLSKATQVYVLKEQTMWDRQCGTQDTVSHCRFGGSTYRADHTHCTGWDTKLCSDSYLSYYTVCSISNFESVPTKLFLHRQTMNELHQTKDGGM